jgi:hypothetical protein
MGHSLAMMTFDVATSTFSNLPDIATDPNHYLGWPAFTPDEEWVTFDADNRSDYLTWSVRNRYERHRILMQDGPDERAHSRPACSRSRTSRSS